MMSCLCQGTRTTTVIEVDIGMRDHLVHVVEGEFGAELLRRCFRGLLMRGADCLQLIARQCLQCRHMGICPPAAPARRHGRPDDSDPNFVCHYCSPCLRL